MGRTCKLHTERTWIQTQDLLNATKTKKTSICFQNFWKYIENWIPIWSESAQGTKEGNLHFSWRTLQNLCISEQGGMSKNRMKENFWSTGKFSKFSVVETDHQELNKTANSKRQREEPGATQRLIDEGEMKQTLTLRNCWQKLSKLLLQSLVDFSALNNVIKFCFFIQLHWRWADHLFVSGLLL